MNINLVQHKAMWQDVLMNDLSTVYHSNMVGYEDPALMNGLEVTGKWRIVVSA